MRCEYTANIHAVHEDIERISTSRPLSKLHTVQLSTQDVDTFGDVGHDPVKALLDVGADAGAARTDRPRVRLDGSQVQPLLGVDGHRIIVGPGLSAYFRSSARGRTSERTSAMASSEWAPGMSCLFASTSSDAPVSLWPPGHPRHAASLDHISMHGGIPAPLLAGC